MKQQAVMVMIIAAAGIWFAYQFGLFGAKQ